MSDPTIGPRSSPASGCIILCTIVVVFGGLIVLFTTRGLWMSRQIDAFTTDTAIPVPVAEATPEQSATAVEKLIKVRDAALNNATERITFSAEDLNALIASQEILADFRGSAYIEKITADAIVTRVTQTLRGLKPGTFRYLNGTMDFTPLLRRKTIVFQIRDVRIPGKEVPEEFIKSYSSQDLFKLDHTNPLLGDVMRELERVYLEDDQLVVETRTKTNVEKPESAE